MHLKSLLLSIVLSLALATSALAGQTVVHFFVLPASTPASELTQLNDFLIKTAGGYTSMPTRGGDTDSKDGSAKENISYLVAAKKNLSKQIAAYLKEKAGMSGVFMLVWKAERPSL